MKDLKIQPGDHNLSTRLDIMSAAVRHCDTALENFEAYARFKENAEKDAGERVFTKY